MSNNDFNDSKSSDKNVKQKTLPKSLEYDCTKECSYREHGNRITAALTKRSVPDDKVAAFIAKTCCNFANNVDDLGRTALHLTASVGRYAVLEWLIHQGSSFNIRDFESGSTALHRAIYYGCIDCAVLLMRYGASFDVLDDDTRCALQNICRFYDTDASLNVASSNDLLVWGSNKNYNLGIDNETDTTTPQAVEYFRKEHILIEQIALGEYHSLFLDNKSRLYTVGHGKGGRLGNGNENSQPTPKKVNVPMKNTGEKIICISASRNHSLVLTDHSAVFACGINENHQLGVRHAGDKSAVFKQVVTLRDLDVQYLKGVIARNEHSLVYSEYDIYCWGRNNGQLNLDKNVEVVPLPKLMRLPSNTRIKFLEANDFATVVATLEEEVILFYNDRMKFLGNVTSEMMKKVCLFGGDNAKYAKGSAAGLKLLLLMESHNIYLWYERTQQYYKCCYTKIRLEQVDKIFYSGNQLLIQSQGDVYVGKLNQKEKQKPPLAPMDGGFTTKKSKKTSSDWSLMNLDLERLPHIDRAVDIFCNYDFSSFAVLQESNMKYFKMPHLTPEEYGFKKLYNDADINDNVHNLVFHIDGETYPAHKLIVFARAPGLREIISKYIDKDIYLNYEGLTGKMFEIIMKFLYMNYLPNENDLQDIQTSLGPESPDSLLETCELFFEFVEQFQLTNLANYLKSFLLHRPFYLPQIPDKSKFRFIRLRLKDFPELYDIRIICAGDVTIEAHKCILVARLEYFQMMFSHSWAEQSIINLSTIHAEYMLPIIEFLYSADVENFRRQNYSESFLYNMIVYCDQFFIERLRKICEILILEKISIRKCPDMIDFSFMYNCEILKAGCMDFICQNLARALQFRILENCEPEALKCLNKHYRNMFKDIFDYRMITPDSEAIDDDLLLSFVDDFEVDLEYRNDGQEKVVNKSKTKDQKNYGSRQYERDAISSMLESLKLSRNDEATISSTQQSQAVLEAQKVAEKLQENAKSWMKVVGKKDLNKKSTADSILKVNETLRNEEKQKPQFVMLKKSNNESAATFLLQNSPEKEVANLSDDTPSSSSSIVYNLNFADLKATPKREKHSQKERKRLSSGSSEANKSTISDTHVKLIEPTMPIDVPAQPNAWGIVWEQSPSSPEVHGNTPPTGSLADPTSFANTTRRRRSDLKNTTPSPQAGSSNSFSRILEEERQQRDNYERMRNKSLLLTQIEEKAIFEMRCFYNAMGTTDETITIERVPMPMSMNFAVWNHN